MRGRLGNDKWYVYGTGFDGYEATRIVSGETEHWYGHAHCLQCAKVDVLTERGGQVDLRGWHMSFCGAYLKAMHYAAEAGEIYEDPFCVVKWILGD